MFRRGVLVACLALGCLDPDDGPGDLGLALPDGGGSDAATVVGADADLAVGDASVPADTGAPGPDADFTGDLGPVSDATPRDAELDAGEAPDAAGADAEPAGDAGCDYIDLDAFIVKCSSGFRYAYRFVDTNQSCAEYFQLGAFSGSTLLEVIEAAECDPSCQYAPATSVSFIDPCDRRNGYIVFRAADDEQCPPVYEFAEGLFSSVEAWEQALNCGG